MTLQHLADVPKTLAHDHLPRQQFIRPGDLSSDLQTVNYVELAPGQSFLKHSHTDCEECFFIISGETEAEIANKKILLKQGDFLVVEAAEEHSFQNLSKNPCVYFQMRILIEKK
jgi:mannose-6-phosphate isomerase-like protein (cupin superfamily)